MQETTHQQLLLVLSMALFLDLCTIFNLETLMYIASGIDGGVILTIYP